VHFAISQETRIRNGYVYETLGIAGDFPVKLHRT